MITLPASRVVPCERKEITLGMPKIISLEIRGDIKDRFTWYWSIAQHFRYELISSLSGVGP